VLVVLVLVLHGVAIGVDVVVVVVGVDVVVVVGAPSLPRHQVVNMRCLGRGEWKIGWGREMSREMEEGFLPGAPYHLFGLAL